MTADQVIQRLRRLRDERQLTATARKTGLSYRYLRNLVDGEIANPGVRQIDMLRKYLGR